MHRCPVCKRFTRRDRPCSQASDWRHYYVRLPITHAPISQAPARKVLPEPVPYFA